MSDNVEMLSTEIGQTIGKVLKANDDITDIEIIMALLLNVGDVLISIECQGCRRLHKKNIEKLLPSVLRDAMKYAAQQPQHDEHVH